MLMTTVIGILFAYTEVLHNSLLVRAAGMGGAHKASSLALALGNAFALVLLGFSAWAFVLPGKVDWGWVPKAPLFGLSPRCTSRSGIVGPMTAVLLVLGTIPILLFTPDAPRSGVSVPQAFANGAQALWRMVTTVGQLSRRGHLPGGAQLLRRRHDRGADLLRHLRHRGDALGRAGDAGDRHHPDRAGGARRLPGARRSTPSSAPGGRCRWRS